MERPYTTVPTTDVKFFVGDEIEKTPAFGMRTLFVVGVQPVAEILAQAKVQQCSHIYLGANQSFQPRSWGLGDPPRWQSMIEALVETHGLLCTLDLDVRDIEWLQILSISQHPNFIPMISVKLPSITELNPNATLKLDDVGFGHSNPGVWCQPLSSFMQTAHFTSWSEYRKDKPIDQ